MDLHGTDHPRRFTLSRCMYSIAKTGTVYMRSDNQRTKVSMVHFRWSVVSFPSHNTQGPGRPCSTAIPLNSFLFLLNFLVFSSRPTRQLPAHSPSPSLLPYYSPLPTPTPCLTSSTTHPIHTPFSTTPAFPPAALTNPPIHSASASTFSSSNLLPITCTLTHAPS